MALELVFTCPGTLKKLRSSPLGKLLDGFCDWLLEHGFARYTVRKHLSNVSHLNEHLRARNGVWPLTRIDPPLLTRIDPLKLPLNSATVVVG